MTSGDVAFRKSDQAVLFALSTAMQGLYMLFPLLIECDATMFYSYAQFLAGKGGGLAAVRPPGFPAFLALTAVLPDSFTLTMVGHALMGILMPVLIYRTLAPFNRPVAFGAALVSIWSTLPYAAAKQLLADQVFIFLLVAAMYSTSRVYWTRRTVHVYAAILLSFAAWLTRWEGSVALIGTIVAVTVMMRPLRRHYWRVGGAVAIGLVVAVGWSFVRSQTLQDPRLFGSISNGNGLQLMHKVYIDLPGQVMDWELNVLKTRTAGDTAGLIKSFFQPVGWYGVQVVAPENGPASARFRRLMEEEFANRPDIVRSAKPAMDGAYQDPNLPIDFYQEVFGKFDGRPAEMADNFFAQPNNFVLDYMWGRLGLQLGLAETDSLYRNVAIEALVQHPVAMALVLRDLLNFFHLELRGFLVEGTSPFLPLHMRANYFETPFNIAGCAKDRLTPNMWQQYVWDRQATDLPLARTLMAWGDFFGRNLVRAIMGPLALLIWWCLPWSRHRQFFLYVPIVALGMMGIMALAVGGGANTRYEGPTHPFMLVATAGALITIIERLRPALRAPLPGAAAPGPTGVQAQP